MLLVSLCWRGCRIPEVLSVLVSHCFPLSLHMSCCAMVCPPFRSLVSIGFLMSPDMCACVGWYVAFPRSCLLLSAIVLSQLVSHLVSFHACLCGGWSHSIFFAKNLFFYWFLMLSHVFDPVPQNTSGIHPLFGACGGLILFVVCY